METWTFGITMALVGMGGTLLSLWFLTLAIMLMKKLFPGNRKPPA
ncbi:MAG: OadG family protein [Desulfobacterales bacterium]|nr:OadG family protein [Desulfobacterales bacterium]